jgi:hypothetical protein
LMLRARRSRYKRTRVDSPHLGGTSQRGVFRHPFDTALVYALDMDGIALTLNKLNLVQMVLAWLFVACYALALGGMLGSKGSLRAGLLAVVAGAAFAALSDDWVHGTLLMLFTIAGMALFVTAAWTLTLSMAWLLSRERRQAVAGAPDPSAQPATSSRPIRALRALWRTHLAP